jgi:hypothetical protein
MTEKKFTILKKDLTADKRYGKCVMVLQDDSKKFYTALAPSDYEAKRGDRITKTKEISFVSVHPFNTEQEGMDMYKKILKESEN